MDYTSAIGTAKPLEGSVVDLISNEANYQLNIRKLNQDEDQRKAIQQQQAKLSSNKDKEEAFKNFKGIKAEDYKVNSLNGVGLSVINQMMPHYNNATIKLAEEFDTLSIADKTKLQSDIAQMESLPQKLAVASSNLTAMNADKINLINENKIHENKEFTALTSLGKGQNSNSWIPIYNPETKDVDIFFGKMNDKNEFEKGLDGQAVRLDTNGDGKIDQYDHTTMSEIMNSLTSYKFDDKFDVQAELIKDGAKINEETNQVDDGDYKTKTKRYNRLTDDFVQNKYFGIDGKPTPFAISDALTNGVKRDDVSGIDKLKERYLEGLKAQQSIGEEKAKNFNNLQLKKYNNERKEKEVQRTDVAKTNAVFGNDSVYLNNKGQKTDSKINVDSVLENGENFGVEGIYIGNAGGKNSLSNMNVKNVFINKSGKIIIQGISEGKDDEGTPTGIPNKFAGYASAGTESAISKKLGYTNVREYKKYLFQKNNFTPEKPVLKIKEIENNKVKLKTTAISR